MACKPNYIGKFVNVYLVDRAYGGPEEGGWWYEIGTAVSSDQFFTRTNFVTDLLIQKRKWCDEQNAERHSDIGSVLSEGRYEVHVEDEPARDYPAERPHYE